MRQFLISHPKKSWRPVDSSGIVQFTNLVKVSVILSGISQVRSVGVIPNKSPSNFRNVLSIVKLLREGILKE